jgi:hypothetical protein
MICSLSSNEMCSNETRAANPIQILESVSVVCTLEKYFSRTEHSCTILGGRP